MTKRFCATVRPHLLTFALLGVLASGSAEAKPVKVLVLPYQPVYRSVPQKRSAQATALLQGELQKSKGRKVLKGAVSKQPKKQAPSKVPKLRSKAKKHEEKKEILEAIAGWEKLIKEIEAKPADAESATDYLSAHHHLARALLWSAQDDKARAVMSVAARMDPNFPLPDEDYSALYQRWFRKAAKRIMKDRRADLLVKSSLPGAQVLLDGRKMDVAPVLLKKAIPGKHYLSASAAGVPRYAAIVTIRAGKNEPHEISFGTASGGSSVGKVADALAKNSFSSDALRNATKAGKEVGATYVVAGAIAKHGERFHAHTFLVKTSKSAFVRIPTVEFDLDMLTAESDVLGVVNGIDRAIKSFKGDESAVEKVDKKIIAKNTVNEVSAGPSSLGTNVRAPRTTKRKAVDRAIFRPLKGGTIRIKDEEE